MNDSLQGSQTPPGHPHPVTIQPPAALTGNSPTMDGPTTAAGGGLIKPLNPSAISFDVRRTPPPQEDYGIATNIGSSSSTGWMVDEGGAATQQQSSSVSSSGVGGVVAAHGLFGGGLMGHHHPHHPHHHSLYDDPSGFHHHAYFHHHPSPHHPLPHHVQQHPQQQQQHPTSAAAAAAAAEREFLATRATIQHVSRPALVAVLTSLLDDFPHLAPMVRYRCDRAMAAVVSQQQQQQQFGNGGWPQDPYATTGTATSTTSPPGAVTPPSQRRSSGPPQPQRTPLPGAVFPAGAGSNSAATPSSVRHSHRANPDDDHVELCSTHGNMRSMKHLSYRATSGTYECIPGFHCLESSGPPSHSVTPKKEPYTLPVEGAATATSPQSPPPLPMIPPGAPPVGLAAPAVAEELLDVARLQDLLQTVRQVRLGEHSTSTASSPLPPA